VAADLTLVARLKLGAAADDSRWLATDSRPFESVDPLDFFYGEDIAAAFRLYQEVYSGLDPRLNVPMPAALAEYDRWILLVDDEERMCGFACFKTTLWGLKLGLAATDQSAYAKAALVQFLRRALNVEGVYGEVSERLESAMAGHVPVVPAAAVGRILGKAVTEDPDGRYYSREITNVGRKTKLMVGKPAESRKRDRA
jgi:hypothetical protein